MAQLIKLQDYISRYETDFFRYPSQFMRMKKEGFGKLLEKSEKYNLEDRVEDEETEEHSNEKFKLRNWFKKQKDEDSFLPKNNLEQNRFLPANKEDLKKYFLDSIFPFQIKWSSSTVFESSFVDKKYHHDPLLKYFLQRFPDTFLIMYYPIFKLKKATLEGEIIIITPIEIFCVSVLEKQRQVKIMTNESRIWYEEFQGIQTKMISPLIGLKRTESIVKGILKQHDISLPVYKLVLSRTNEIHFLSEPFHTQYIGKSQYNDWFNQLRRNPLPLKHDQLKAGAALLSHSQTTAVKRPEWEQGEDDEHPII